MNSSNLNSTIHNLKFSDITHDLFIYLNNHVIINDFSRVQIIEREDCIINSF